MMSYCWINQFRRLGADDITFDVSLMSREVTQLQVFQIYYETLKTESTSRSSDDYFLSHRSSLIKALR